jgi:superoxide dismutase, Cu-Zn family
MSRTVPALTAVTALACTAMLATFPIAAAAAPPPVVHVGGPLVSYDLTRVPMGASATVTAVATGSGKMIVTLHVSGLLPDTDYGAHAHVNPCGTTGAAAGPHYQYNRDPVTPSTNPEYANPANEIWLDLTTNPAGQGRAMTVVDWQFPTDRSAGSVILHIEHTHTGPADSGVAGTRLGCLTVPF